VFGASSAPLADGERALSGCISLVVGGTETGLLAAYELDEAAADTVTDLKGLANGTITGHAPIPPNPAKTGAATLKIALRAGRTGWRKYCRIRADLAG